MNSSADTNTISIKVVDDRIGALAAHLGCEIDDISACTYDECAFEACGGEYLVLTSCEADELTRQRIEESLWAFSASFIASHTRNGSRLSA
jgi:hypothetical protein